MNDARVAFETASAERLIGDPLVEGNSRHGGSAYGMPLRRRGEDSRRTGTGNRERINDFAGGIHRTNRVRPRAVAGRAYLPPRIVAPAPGHPAQDRPVPRRHAVDDALRAVRRLGGGLQAQRDGRRQIINPAIPGDILGFSQLFRHEAHYGAVTLSRASVGMLGREQIDFAFHHHPRLYFGLMGRAMVQHEIVVERLTDVAQHCATTRIAHFAMELLVRHRAVGLAQQGSFPSPLTQRDIADTLGLSIIHVNRVLQSLKRQRLLDWSGRSVVIPDAEKLARVAQFHEQEWQIGNWLDLSWIGAGRPAPGAEPFATPRETPWQGRHSVWGS